MMLNLKKKFCQLLPMLQCLKVYFHCNFSLMNLMLANLNELHVAIIHLLKCDSILLNM